jgi:hypothetical protein
MAKKGTRRPRTGSRTRRWVDAKWLNDVFGLKVQQVDADGGTEMGVAARQDTFWRASRPMRS